MLFAMKTGYFQSNVIISTFSWYPQYSSCLHCVECDITMVMFAMKTGYFHSNVILSICFSWYPQYFSWLYCVERDITMVICCLP